LNCVIQSFPVALLLLQVSSESLPAAAVVLAMHRLQRLQRELAQQAGQQQQQPDQEQQQLVCQVLQQLTDRLAEVRALCVAQWCVWQELQLFYTQLLMACASVLLAYVDKFAVQSCGSYHSARLVCNHLM
jgi:hypothetical protein